MPETLSGLIERVTFHNPESGFVVLQVKLKGREDLVPLIGNTPSVTAGEHVEASGRWVIDREHGRQFKADELKHDKELDLLKALGDFPQVVTTAAELSEPHRVARYLEELATTYHRFYDSCRVLPRGDEEATPLTTARLWLCAATAVVLRNGLGVLGVSAPERM